MTNKEGFANAGYPKFSEVHEYPNIKKEIKKGQEQYYQNSEKHKHKHKDKKSKKKKNPKQQTQTMPETNQIHLVPKNQLYMSQGGHEYMAVPVGKPKLVPMIVPQTKYQIERPQYLLTQPQYQPQYQMAQPQYQIKYQAKPKAPKAYIYPYYRQTSSPVFVFTSGY